MKIKLKEMVHEPRNNFIQNSFQNILYGNNHVTIMLKKKINVTHNNDSVMSQYISLYQSELSFHQNKHFLYHYHVQLANNACRRFLLLSL